MLCYFSINLKIHTFALLLSIIIIYFVVVGFCCTLDFFVIFRTFKKRKNEDEIYVRNSFRRCDDG